jgi:hypothetical protein
LVVGSFDQGRKALPPSSAAAALDGAPGEHGFPIIGTHKALQIVHLVYAIFVKIVKIGINPCVST